MNYVYEHSQVGYVIIVTFVGMIGLFSLLFAFAYPGEILSIWWIFLIFGISLLLFYRLNVRITNDRIKISFGIGLIHRSWSRADILSSEIITCPWWYGWGIHFTPHGTIFNVSGFKAVALRLRSGRTALIGTDEPEKLHKAVTTP